MTLARRTAHLSLTTLLAAAVTTARGHHIDHITVTADFRTDRPAWAVTVSVEARRVLEDTQSTALAGFLESGSETPDAIKADVFIAAGRYLGERLHFSTGQPPEPVTTDYRFSLVGVPGRTGRDLFVVGRHEGALPPGARTVETRLTGGLRAMLIRKVNGEITGPAMTVQPSAGIPTAIEVPPVVPPAAGRPEEGSTRRVVVISLAIGAIAIAALLVYRARRR